MKYEDISKNGYPLGFLIKKAESNTNGLNKTFTSHTRQMDILQKESIGYEGDLNSTSFRLTSDEGKHLNGTDLAPFPLGFFNASIHGDIVGTIMKQAVSQGLKIDNIDCAFTSPPYFSTERYNEGGEKEENQSWFKFDEYSKWRDDFYLPVAQKSFERSKHMFVNIMDPNIKNKRYYQVMN